ncbi:hypothetical protein AMATHDRAFT_177051 [Amanita thiersii Skay4041]|uniref:Signal recognition particle subunit SRP72 n=1 Tax=Amanita thiersii Skay4041 TaxID=703135 RepID=A0A2A9NRZ5_9AGAR|nr:hypothetical protein AMATHDRAFT_177051 [Amanita thiersii Skay4041]
MSTKPSTTRSALGTKKPQGKVVARKGPKKLLPVPDRLKRLFTSLYAQIDGGHFNNAIKTCDKVLSLDPKDNDALRTKLFLLLQTEQYITALELITTQPTMSQFGFEEAYALYRLQRETEASQKLNELKALQGDDRGSIHLQAQMSYRQGSYQVALDLYNQLLDTAEPGSEEHSDILTNLQASQQHLDFINTGFLQALDALPVQISSAIESAPPPAATAPSITASLLSTSLKADDPVNDQQAKPATKKVRKSRVPPGVIPGVTPPPDPERWLKKSERSTFAQGRRRKGGGGGATQGVASVESSTLVPTGPISHTPKSGGSKGKKRK